MARSHSFVAVSVVTAASLAVSSVALAGPLPPSVSAGAAERPLIHKIDSPQYQQDRKRVQWERNYYGDQRGQRRGAPSSKQGYQGAPQGGPTPKQGYHGAPHGAPPPKQSYRGPDRAPPPPQRGARPAHGYGGPPPRTVVVVRHVPPGPRVVPPPHRRVYYRNVWIVRPYGHWYPGYGYYYQDHDAYPWLAFTAISLSLLTLLTISQQRAQEQAQIDATTAPVGSTIVWNDANAAGSVSVLRDGRSSDGQYCREFQQTVTIGGRSEQAYGAACQQPDGSWRIVDTR